MRINLLVAALIIGVLCNNNADAAISIRMYESGDDVVFSYSGSLALAEQPIIAPNFFNSRVIPAVSWISFETGSLWDRYLNGIVGPLSFGGGSSLRLADAGNTGDGLALIAGRDLYLPRGYVSETELSGSMTYRYTDFSDLEIDPGSGPYVWTVQDSAADTITLKVVPEPTSTLWLCGSGAMICLCPRRCRVG